MITARKSIREETPMNYNRRPTLSTTHRRVLRGVACALLGAVMLQGGAVAAQVPAPAQNGAVALTGATIHTVTNGVVENGTIVFENGVITAIGSNIAVPANAQRVDVSGKHIYPGLIDAYSAMGLEEIGAVDVTLDTDELGDFNPNVRAEVAVNPESRHIGTARSNGVLVTITTPSGGIVSGLSAALMLDGWTWESMTLESGAALNVNWPDPNPRPRGGPWMMMQQQGSNTPQPTYAERVRSLRDMFATARAYRDAQASGRPHDSDLRWEAMVSVVNGDVPVVVSANSVQQMQDAIAFGEAEGLRIVLRGAADALLIADHLAAKQIPVLLTSTMNQPGRDWQGYDSNYSLPAQLHAKGVPFAITGGSSAPYTHRLPWEAGAAVAYGLSEEEALRSVTISPARFLGIDDRVGSLEAGKHATLLITSGNPLDYTADIEQAYVQGRAIDMNDAFRQLYEKYSERLRQTQGMVGEVIQ